MAKIISNDAPGSTGRHDRLSRVLSACQSFCCLSEEPEDQSARLARFNRCLLQIEDDKGTLNLLWASDADKQEFSALLELAWRFQVESGPVNHAVTISI